jgi:integrase
MPKKSPVPCTKEEIDALIKEVADNDFYWTLFNLAKTTGRRLGEYYSLKVSDIDFDKNIMMTEILKRRIKVRREAILREDISLMLKQFIARSRLKETDFVFQSMSYRAIQNAVTSAAKKAGINHAVSFHNFRHYFITSLVRKGWKYDEIAKLTGHSTPQTILFYDHALPSETMDKALAGIEDM